MSQRTISKVALYARCSTRSQADGGHSIAAQLHDLRTYAHLYKMTTVAVVIDEAESGKSLDRPGIVAIRELISSGTIEALVVLKLDRLTRDVADLGVLLRELEASDIALMTVDASEKLDTSTAGGRLVLNLLVSVSQWEREVIGERTKSGLAQARRAGRYVGRPPFGFRVENGSLTRDESQQAVIRRMRRHRQQGHSYSAIADALNAERVPSASNGTWHAATVSRTLNARQRRTRRSLHTG